MAVNINDERFALSHTVAGNMNAKRDSLEEGGRLQTQAAHWLVVARPELCTLTPQGPYVVDCHAIEWIGLRVLQWCQALKDRNMLWYMTPARFSRLLANAHAVGKLDWRHFGSDWAIVYHLRAALPHLPAGQEALLLADVHAFTVPAVPSCLAEKVLANMFQEAVTTPQEGNGMDVAVDYKCTMSDGYILNRRVDPAGHYMNMQTLVLESINSTLSTKPLSMQASMVVQFFKDTKPDTKALCVYIGWDKQDGEVLRRGRDSESARFTTLLARAHDAGLDGGYPECKLIFDKACTGTEYVQHVGVLAARLKLSELTHVVCRSLCDMLTAAVRAQVDTEELKTESNVVRGRIIGDYLAIMSSRDKEEPKARTASDKMHASATFITLNASLEKEVAAKPNYDNVVKIIAGTAAGQHFLIKKATPGPVWSNFKAARQESVMDSALNAIIAVDNDGTSLGKTVVANGLARKLIAGQFGPSKLPPWAKMIAPIIEARDGKHAVAMEAQGDNGEFWSDSRRLQLAEPIMGAEMSFMGKTGRHKLSFKAFMRWQIESARAIDVLPDNFKRKAKLYVKLGRIGTLSMTECAEQCQILLEEPLETAVVSSDYLTVGSVTDKEMIEFSTDLKEAQSKVRLNDDYGDDDDFYAGAKRNRVGGATQWEWDEPTSKEPRQSWRGKQLETFGVWLSTDGPVFGARFLVVVNSGSGVVDPNSCVASICHCQNMARRMEWCNLGTCKDHPRPNGFTDDNFRVIDLYHKSPSPADKTVIDRVIASKASWAWLAGMDNRELVLGFGKGATPRQGGGGGGGKGGGKGGKGGGKGRGGKGGGGKGKGGKGKGKGKGGSPNFGRQR